MPVAASWSMFGEALLRSTLLYPKSFQPASSRRKKTMWGMAVLGVAGLSEESSSVEHATLPPHIFALTGWVVAALSPDEVALDSRGAAVSLVAAFAFGLTAPLTLMGAAVFSPLANSVAPVDAPPLPMAPLPRYMVPAMARPARVARPRFCHTRELGAVCASVAARSRSVALFSADVAGTAPYVLIPLPSIPLAQRGAGTAAIQYRKPNGYECERQTLPRFQPIKSPESSRTGSQKYS